MKVALVIVYFGRQPLYWQEEGADGMPIGPSLPIAWCWPCRQAQVAEHL